MPSEYNPNLVASMEAKFRRLNNPAHAMADAVGMLQMFPGLVGLWPGSTTDAAGQRIDVSGNGNHLARTNSLDTVFGLVPCVYYGGSARHSHADGAPFDIIGTETHISSSYRGLTIGCWVRFENAASAFEVIAGKWGAGGNSYKIQRTDTGLIQFAINDGSTSYTVASTTVIGTSGWVFCCGRYDPSASIEIFANSEIVQNTTSIPASLNNSSSTFTIGSQDAGASPMTGWTFGAFLASADVPDSFINSYYQFTAPLFGVTV
jgi:hypothetical protein